MLVLESNCKYIIVVIVCFIGIVYIYMVEDVLKKKVKEMGVDIKVEINGLEGIKNCLIVEDIVCVDGVIVVVDKKVEMNCFDGKKLVNCFVSDGICKIEELINLVISGEVFIFYGSDLVVSD